MTERRRDGETERGRGRRGQRDSETERQRDRETERRTETVRQRRRENEWEEVGGGCGRGVGGRET